MKLLKKRNIKRLREHEREREAESQYALEKEKKKNSSNNKDKDENCLTRKNPKISSIYLPCHHKEFVFVFKSNINAHL